MTFSRGIWFMIMATVFLAVMQALVKMLPNIPVAQIILIRALVSMVLSFVVIRSAQIDIRGKKISLLLIRGLVGTASLLTFFYTIQKIPLATAVTIGYLAPLFLGILAGVFLKDKLHPAQWLTVLISFAGVYLIKGFDPRVSGEDVLIAVFSALLAALAHFSVRMLKEEHPLVILFYFSAVVIPVLGPYVILNWVNPTSNEWGYLLAVAIASHLGQIGLTNALKLEKITNLLAFYYVGIILAIFFGYIFFEETFNPFTILGMLLILGGVFFNHRLRLRNNWGNQNLRKIQKED